jgi:hypothetical protein
VWRALLDLVGERVTIPGRATHQYVGDEDLAPPESDLGQVLVEQLSGRTDEREALLVLVVARGLPHEHQVGVGVPRSEHEVRAGGLERAVVAAAKALVELDQVATTISRAALTHGP